MLLRYLPMRFPVLTKRMLLRLGLWGFEYGGLSWLLFGLRAIQVLPNTDCVYAPCLVLTFDIFRY